MGNYREGQKVVILSCGRIVEAEIIEVGELPRHSWLVAEHRAGEEIIHTAEITSRPGWAAWLSFIKGRERELIGRAARQYRTGNSEHPYDYELILGTR